MAQAIRWDLVADPRRFQKGFRDAEQASDRFSRGFKRVAGLVGTAFAGIAITRVFAGFLEEGREAQRVGRQTAAVIKSTGGAAGLTAKDFERLAGSISRKVGVDDEVIQSGQNILATFTRVRNETGKGRDVFNQATRAAVDMAAALNQGEVTAQGLQRANIQLGKALNDPLKGISALTRVGVTFSKQQKDQIAQFIKQGDVAKAQGVILAEVTKEFGGSAEAAATGWDRFMVQIGNIQEMVGTALLPILDRSATFLGTTLLPAVESFAGGVSRSIGPAISGLTSDIQRKFDEFKPKLETFRTNLVTGIKKLGKPVVDAIGTALKTGDWKPIGIALGDALKQIVGDGVSLFSKVFSGVDWTNVGKTIGAHAFGFAVGFVSALGSDILDVAREHPVDLIVFVGSILAFGKIGNVIARVLGKIPFLRAFAPLFEGLNKLTGPVNKAIGTMVSFIGKGFREGFETVFPRAAKLLRGHIGDMIAWLQLRAEVFRKAGSRMIAFLAHAIGSEVGLVLRNIGQVIAAITRPFRGSAGWLIRRGIEAVAGLARGIGSMLGTVSRLVSGVIGRVTSPFRGAGGWLVGRGRQVLQGFWNGMFSIWRKIQSWISNAVPNWIKAHKGPISLDQRLLVPAGAAIMGGFLRGLKSGGKAAMDYLKSIGADIAALYGAVFGAPSVGPTSYGSNRALVKRVAEALYGWTGGQWIALANLIAGESGFNNLAQNPTSSAFGMFQFLDSTWGSVGAKKTADPYAQTVAGLRYISNRYGSPAAAYGAWLGRTPHWYGEGGIFKKPAIIGVGEKGPEAVVPLGHSMGRLSREDARMIAQELAKVIPTTVQVIDVQAGLLRHKRNGGGVALGLS